MVGLKEEGKVNRPSTEDWAGAVKLFCINTKMVDTWHYLLKLIKCTTPRVNPKWKYGSWVTMVEPCRFTSCNKCTILASDDGNGKTYTRVGQVVCWKPLYLLFHFAVNLKLFFKSLFCFVFFNWVWVGRLLQYWLRSPWNYGSRSLFEQRLPRLAISSTAKITLAIAIGTADLYGIEWHFSKHVEKSTGM